MRDADNCGAQGLELIGRLGKIVRFNRAARCERRGVEIQYYRAFLKCISERECKALAGKRRLRREIWGFLAVRQGGQCRRGDQSTQERTA